MVGLKGPWNPSLFAKHCSWFHKTEISPPEHFRRWKRVMRWREEERTMWPELASSQIFPASFGPCCWSQSESSNCMFDMILNTCVLEDTVLGGVFKWCCEFNRSEHGVWERWQGGCVVSKDAKWKTDTPASECNGSDKSNFLMMASLGRAGLRKAGEQTGFVSNWAGGCSSHTGVFGTGLTWCWFLHAAPHRSVLLCTVLSAKKKIISQNICKVAWPQA